MHITNTSVDDSIAYSTGKTENAQQYIICQTRLATTFLCLVTYRACRGHNVKHECGRTWCQAASTRAMFPCIRHFWLHGGSKFSSSSLRHYQLWLLAVCIEEEYACASAHLVRSGGVEIDAKGRFALNGRAWGEAVKALAYELCSNPSAETAASHQAW